jgi:hypothetical protein
MLAAAESDFKANDVNRRIEQLRKIGPIRAADVERKPRQQMFDQVGLTGAELVALAPAEERTVRVSGSVIVGQCFAVAGDDGHRSADPWFHALKPQRQSAGAGKDGLCRISTALKPKPAELRAFSVPIESERRLYLFILTRFLDANRYPLRWKTR